MRTADLDVLFSKLSRLFSDGPQAEVFSRLLPHAVVRLAAGRPVTPVELAAATGRTAAEVGRLLQQLPGVEMDDAGNLVGMGLTLRPTPHRFEVEGRSLYTWCAFDALLFPVILGKTVRVRSPCPGTGAPVRARVSPAGLEELDPPEAVVSLRVPDTFENLRGSFCGFVHFFRSAAAAADWLRSRPDAVVLSVDEAFALGRRLAYDRFGVGSS
ncbi:organomercurial lyase MerB [Oceanithermus desulfurans]|uniref:Alkylmercury lyase n=2 Tax=Oceanithermus desulfurans TaxID=227924 RepID=A0A511RGA6_9DEIN|nr:organomercurial lyase MerB [Oceanithermus desulfurans]MBB6030121.1 alkylmercury lyase [Oceanithermus desulfurans]GEM88679.1 alkylmercury lyase [Oceanithermus desulfurans NBRC 100063]